MGVPFEALAFLGWKDEATEHTYSPGDTIQLSGDVSLVALWGYAVESSANQLTAVSGLRGQVTLLAARADTDVYGPCSIPDFVTLQSSLAAQGITIEETGEGTYLIALENGDIASIPGLEEGVKFSVTEVGYLDADGNLVALDTDDVEIAVMGDDYEINGLQTTGTIGTSATEVVYINNYASVEPDPTYTVNYDPNGGSGSYADTELTSGSDYAVKGQSDTGFTRDGYTFKGWNTKADGSGTAYAAGGKITITGDVTLYAQWEKTTSGGTMTSKPGASRTPGASGVPKTGDTNNIGLWITLLCVCLAGAVYLAVCGRKLRRQEH